MFRRYLLSALAVGALVGTGCVPVTEPVGAVDKAESDKALVGKWTVTKSGGYVALLNVTALTIDTPDVKGNPKGLMRAVVTAGSDSNCWFTITTVGKHTYASIVLESNGTRFPKFDEEGAFEEWKTDADKHYYTLKYALDGDQLKIDCGSTDKFQALMKDERFFFPDGKRLYFYEVPAGWLAKHLDETDPKTIFDGSNVLELKREKK